MRSRPFATLLAVLLFLLAPSGAAAAAIDLRVTDRLDLGASAVASFPLNTSSVVAAVNYNELPVDSRIDLALVNSAGQTVASYQEPVPRGGSGAAVVRLIAETPLPPGSYRVRASATGTEPLEAGFVVGPPPLETPAPTPTATLTPMPGGQPDRVTPPVQLASPVGDLASRTLAGPVPSARAGPANDPRFGLANVLPDGQAIPGVPSSARIAWMTRAVQSGAGGNRWEFRWDRIEPEPGVFDWSDADRIVAANEASNLPLLVILIGTPAWAGKPSAPPPGLGAPPILADGTIHPENVWGRFVHAFASRYQGRIDAYEIWNEPNRPDFWSGTPEQYYQLLATAMACVRHADGGARVVFGGLDGYRDLGFLHRVLDVAAADPAPPGRRGAFDVLAWHAYHRPSDVYAGTLLLRETLRARRLSQPIWITETNVAAWDDHRVRGDDPTPYRWSATAEEQASFVVQALAYAVLADVERIYLYRASDTGEGEAWGLLRVDGSSRPAESAFRFATSAFAGAQRTHRSQREGVEILEIERPSERVTIAWSTAPADAPLVLDALANRPAELRDKIGGVGSVSPVGGRYILSLPGASASQGAYPGDYPIGGDPYIIVEARP